MPSLLLGVTFANLFMGIPIDGEGVFHGTLMGLVNGYGIAGAIFFLVMFMLHGSLWLAIKSQGELQTRAVASANLLWPVMLILLVAFLAGRLIPDSAVAADFAQAKEPPSWSHPFGTDHLGRDLFLRTLKGLSTSLTVGICASAISAVAAVLIGIAAATGSRAMDSFINWLIDLVMGVPHTVLVILISFACGRGLKGLLIGVAATHWTSLARLIRGEVLQLRSQQYVAVSRRLGKSSGWILLHHLLPHLVPQFLVGLILMLPHAILHEASILSLIHI